LARSAHRPSHTHCSPAPGCVLAHAMGLGKTLTCVAFTLMYLRHRKGRTVMVVAPAEAPEEVNDIWILHRNLFLNYPT